MQIERAHKSRQGLDRPIIHSANYVTDLQSSRFSRAAGQHIGDDNPIVLLEPKSFRHGGRDGLRSGLDFRPVNVTILAQTAVHELDDTRRNREAETLTAAARRKNKGIDAEHVAFNVHERAAAVSRIDGSV